ncbi:DUF2335 domain-containing protein [Lactobacillus sp. PSON]|uniref:DUF2335 domain-containing protein n=1 Tax=Lactobacillus sp. PSON TaxID=3455454 RepID=UPI00404365F0
MKNQDKKLPAEAEKTEKEIDDKNNQEIINQVKKLPLSNDEKNNIIATIDMYSGPIPHPKILAGYEALDHGAAKEIIDNGIEESKHRRKLETARQKRRGHLAWASMIILALVCLIFMLGSFYLILNDHKIIGGIFGGSSFLIFVGYFFNYIDKLTSNNDISVNKTIEDTDKDNSK